MEVLESIEVLAGDAAALGQQGREVVRPGAEGLRLFQQNGMAGERLAVGYAERHGIAFNAGPFAQLVVSRQNLLTATDKGGNRLGVTPAEGGAPDIPRDAGQGVNGGGIMHHAERPGGPVAAAQNCATYSPLSVVVRGRRCTAWSSMRRFVWRLSTRV